MWYLIFVLTFASGAHVQYLDANGQGKIYTDLAKCEADGHAWLDGVAAAHPEAQAAWGACIKLPGVST
jgi:hypothetical protein